MRNFDGICSFFRSFVRSFVRLSSWFVRCFFVAWFLVPQMAGTTMKPAYKHIVPHFYLSWLKTISFCGIFAITKQISGTFGWLKRRTEAVEECCKVQRYAEKPTQNTKCQSLAFQCLSLPIMAPFLRPSHSCMAASSITMREQERQFPRAKNQITKRISYDKIRCACVCVCVCNRTLYCVQLYCTVLYIDVIDF